MGNHPFSEVNFNRTRIYKSCISGLSLTYFIRALKSLKEKLSLETKRKEQFDFYCLSALEEIDSWICCII